MRANQAVAVCDNASGRDRPEAVVLPPVAAANPAVKTTAALLKLYERIYGFAVAILLIASGVAFASAWSFS